MRDRSDRRIVRAAEKQLAAIRNTLTPEVIEANINALQYVRDNSKDFRAKNMAVKIMNDMLDKTLDRDRPIAKNVDVDIDANIVTRVVEEVVHVTKPQLTQDQQVRADAEIAQLVESLPDAEDSVYKFKSQKKAKVA